MQQMKASKAALTALLSGIAAFLGWKGILALGWIGAMALDYLSGTLAACKAGQWSSAQARAGIWHKCGMILTVAVAAIADGLMGLACGNIPVLKIDWPGLILPLVLTWYILTELGSILENAVKLGAVVPQWLRRLLKAGRDAVDTGAGSGEKTE